MAKLESDIDHQEHEVNCVIASCTFVVQTSFTTPLLTNYPSCTSWWIFSLSAPFALFISPEGLQCNAPAIEHRIRMFVDPVAEVDIRAILKAFDVRLMIMAHNDHIESFADLLTCELHHVVPFIRLFAGMLPARPGRPACDHARDIGVDQRKQKDTDPVSEHGLEHTVACVVSQKPVSVMQKETFAIEVSLDGFERDFDAELFWKERFQPEIVIPCKERYADACIGKFRELAENAHMSGWDDRAVFEPEVEQVAGDKHLFGVPHDRVEKSQEHAFLRPFALGSVQAEMNVRKEVNAGALRRLNSCHVRKYRSKSKC